MRARSAAAHGVPICWVLYLGARVQAVRDFFTAASPIYEELPPVVRQSSGSLCAACAKEQRGQGTRTQRTRARRPSGALSGSRHGYGALERLARDETGITQAKQLSAAAIKAIKGGGTRPKH
jgi:hypothetical protein